MHSFDIEALNLVDINLARTFLAIASSGSLLRASEQLHVTQTAVGARLRMLEGLLGRKLFVRNKAGAALTPAGEQFSRYATGLVQLWERARHHVAVPAGRRDVLNIGCEVSLWDPLLLDWLLCMRKLAPHLAIRTEVGLPDELLRRVGDGVLDIAVVYAPRLKPGLRIELLIEEKLVLVTTAKRGRVPNPADYVFVDWGPEFAAQHGMAYPQLMNAGLTAGLGLLGLGYVLAAGGAGYFRLDVVRPHLDAGRLRRVAGAPEFLYPAYAVYAEATEADTVSAGLEGLRRVVQPTLRRRSKSRL